MNGKIFCLLALFWTPAFSFAQPAGVETLTTRDGLSQGYISSLLQDSDGFVWAGTKSGLNRFDGYRFDVFTHDPYDEHTLSNDYITSISENGAFLVVGTANNGLNIFHKNTRSVNRLPNEILAPGNRDISILWTAIDADGNIWVYTSVPDHPLFLSKVILPAGFWEKPQPNADWWKKVRVENWPQRPLYTGPALSADGKTLYAVATDTLFQIDAHTGAWTVMMQLAPARNIALTLDAEGSCWIVWEQGLKRELRRLRPGVAHPTPADLELVPTTTRFISVVAVNKPYIWLQFDAEARAFELDEQGHFDVGRPTLTGFPARSIFLTDRSGLLWVGTNGLGLMKVNLRSRHFQHLLTGQSISQPILQDRSGSIFTYNYNSQLLTYPDVLPPASAAVRPALSSLTDGRIVQDAHGNYWVLGTIPQTSDLVLDKIDAAGNRRRFPVPERSYWQHAMTLDKTGAPWIGVHGQFLRLDPTTERFTRYDFTSVLPEPHTVSALLQTGDGGWWIATNKGLIQARPSAQGFDFQLFKNDPSNRNSLRNNIVLSLLPDPSDANVLWIGTNGGGLDRLEIRTLQFTHLTSRDGLPNDVIYGILPDEDGHLWLSSNKGLIRYTPATGQLKNYTEEDGVQANEFNTNAFGKGPNGELLFGGVNGITRFRLRDLQENVVIPPVHISDLRLNDQSVSWSGHDAMMQQAPEFTRRIVVPYAQNNITLGFVALDYSVPQKNRFRYYLEGAETEWVHEGAEHRATYLNLAPGIYTFKVKGCNSDGVWNDTPAELEITVLPPWYRSWWAWVCYVSAVSGMVYLVYRYQLRQRLEHAENQRLKELDAFKSRFFTNVTHEFRTPLTVILGMAERLMGKEGRSTVDGEGKNGLNLIKRNGENLLRLINEILDLAKLESNTLKIHYLQGDVLAYLRYIIESLYSLANTKNILLRLESDQPGIVMDYDPERLLQIVHNLLSNAIKFTPSGGKVLLTAGQALQGKAETFVLQVTDTGAGIPAEDVPHVFDRFYQGRNQEQAKAGGAGIGLSLTRELVRAMHGTITVESRPGQKTTFTVTLPLTRLAPTEKAVENPVFTAPGSVMPPAAVVQAAGDAEKPHLLLIEDNPDVVEYLAACLAPHYRLDYAYNGRAGIEKAFETTPQLIISDVMMPEKDGLEVCDTLKNDTRTSHVPIVLLTAKATLGDRIAGLRRGADAYLAKPFHEEELLVQLHRLLDTQQKMQARYAQLSLSADATGPVSSPETALEDAFLVKLRTYLQDHLGDARLSPDDICRSMGIGRTSLHNKLQALTGMPITLYLRALRLRQARELLRNPALNVSEVAYAVGFDDPKYFSRVFAEEFGAPPSALRGGSFTTE